ncbi:MAG: 1-acyl-sn-glycerol-3-phosphate acyltransferase [Clostridiales bacterium]|nr:1-acyl-sn-glycerol-3-phosphate acyltransferase [Clostridiales bacterium]
MNFFQKIPYCVFKLLYPSKIYGKENIPEGTAVFVCNHFSALDCGFVLKAYPKDIYFLAKKELFEKKICAKFLKSYGGLPIDRDNPDMRTLIAPIKVLKEGHKLAIFPEGTRNKTKTNELQEIKGGTVIFAVKARCPIVPMMLSGKCRIFRKTRLIIGKPFYLDEFYGKKLTDDVIDEMAKKVREKMLEQQRLLSLQTSKKRKK